MAAGDWTPEAAVAISLCGTWAKQVAAQHPCQIYLFGSAIYEGGDQFDPELSDLDLVVWFADPADVTVRAQRLSALRDLKLQLELQMVPALHRTNCEDPGASLLPVTTLEIQANTHKSGARRFFDRNVYLNLLTGSQSIGLPNAGVCSAADDARQALELVQQVRNKYLAISANSTGGLTSFDAGDPLPKSFARASAQLLPDVAPGAWYDTRFGLDYLFDELSRRRTESTDLAALHRKISVRRGGRGRRFPLSDYDQLLLAEIIYDNAAAFPLEPIAQWEVRFSGTTITPIKRDEILSQLRNLLPDAQIVDVVSGSLIVRLRSSKRRYTVFLRLNQLGALPQLFEVEKIDVSLLLDSYLNDSLTSLGVLDRLAQHIGLWRPKSYPDMAQAEQELAQWVRDWLKGESALSERQVAREIFIGDGERPLRADIVVRYRENDDQGRIAVELVRLRTRDTFFRQIDRVRGIGVPVILVVMGSLEQIEGLDEEFKKVRRLDATIRVVSVQLNDD